MEHTSEEDVQAFARTFAPDEERSPRRPRRQLLWLAAGLTFVAGGAVVLLAAWLAFRHAIPAEQLRRAPGESLAGARDRNGRAAPLVAVSALPLLAGGIWLLVKRPPNERARFVAVAAGVGFGIAGFVASALGG